MEATVTSKGQITLPKAIREHFQLHTGDKVQFIIMDDGHVFLIPPKIPLAQLKGILPPPERALTIEEMEQTIETEAVRRQFSS